jgi:pimeloyl-ACP methyl ester carboxylesterase
MVLLLLYAALISSRCYAAAPEEMMTSCASGLCDTESAMMAAEADDGLVLLQKTAKTMQAHAMHSEEDAAGQAYSMSKLGNKLASAIKHKLNHNYTTKNYQMAQVLVLVAITGALVGFSCLGCAFKIRMRKPKPTWLDYRAEGGIRHRVLEWPGSVKKAPETKEELCNVSKESGRPVVFLHAASLCAASWTPVVSRLSNVTAIACDLRGHGDSDAPQGSASYTWDLVGEDILRIIESVTATYCIPPDVVTHSFAGDCLLMALAKRPVPVGRLVLLDPVVADAEGATVGAKCLAEATRKCATREKNGWRSAKEVGEHLEDSLRKQLCRDTLDESVKAAFADAGCAKDNEGRWRLKCSRQNEAAIYENRVSLADHLSTKKVDADVRLVIAEKRQTAIAIGQKEAANRDRNEAERVLKRCQSGSLHTLDDVGHFMVLEAPEVVAAKLKKLLAAAN